MMLSQKEKEKLVKDLITLVGQIQKTSDSLTSVFGSSCDLQLLEPSYLLLDKHINLISRCIGDTTHKLAWYIFNNDCGLNELRVTLPNKKQYVVKSVKQLLKVIDKIGDK